MENKINFTGIRNIASVPFKREGFHTTRNISLMLTNDSYGQDLQEFTDVLSKITSNSSVYKAEDYLNVLNLECLHGADDNRWLSVNGTILEPNDKTVPMFSFLAKLTRKIMNMPEKEMSVNEYYKNNIANDVLVYGQEFDNYEQLVKDGFIDKLFDKNNVRDGAKNINDSIQKIMNKFLGIKE